MSLHQRLAAVQPMKSNTGCVTCQYLEKLPSGDRQAFDDWLAAGHSRVQLWEICAAEGLTVGDTGFRNHLRHHRRADEP
jgi:hypothetical protein